MCLVRRSAGVRPEVRFRPARFLGWAMTPASRRARGAGPGGQRRDHVAGQQERPDFLAGQGHRLAAHDAPTAAQGFLQVEAGDFHLPPAATSADPSTATKDGR